jgi:hypothetical protein
MILQSPEEDRNETTGNKLSSLTSDSASASLNDATSQQVEDETETKNSTAVDESLGEGEESFFYGLHFLSLQRQQSLLVPSKLEYVYFFWYII